MNIKPYVAPKKIFTVDIETGATEPDAVIFSTGVTVWQLQEDRIHYRMSDYFHNLVKHNHDDGRVLQRATMDWHFNLPRNSRNPSLNVSAYHRDVATTMGYRLKTHLLMLAKFYMRHTAGMDTREVALYANGPDFDHTVLNHAFSQNGIDFHLNPFMSKSIRNCMDFAGAAIAGGEITADEIFARREGDKLIKYATPNFYADGGFRAECDIALAENINLTELNFLPPEEPHCDIYDAEREGRLAVYFHEQLNKKVV